jgi:hypothetical protein
MAIVSVTEMRGRSGGNNVKLKGTRRAKYRVKTDSITHGPDEIYNASGIPEWWTVDPEGGGRYVQDKSAEQSEENPKYWVVTVEYTTPDEGNNEDGDDPPDPSDPTTRRPILNRSTWKYTKNVIKDQPGNLIVNAAGQPPAEGLDIEVCGLLYTYTKWSDTVGEALFTSHLNHINNPAWQGHAVRTALCSDISIEEERVDGNLFYKHTYQVMVRTDGSEWDPQILNWGFKEKVGGDLIEIRDAQNAVIQQPWFLDAAGAAVRPQDPLAADNFVAVDIYPEAAFSTLW